LFPADRARLISFASSKRYDPAKDMIVNITASVNATREMLHHVYVLYLDAGLFYRFMQWKDGVQTISSRKNLTYKIV
jgi:hypothetical protein